MENTNKSQIALIRICYLLPPILAIFYLFFGYLPHFYYLSDGEAMANISLFSLMSNTLQSCKGFLNGTASGTTADLYFSYVILSIWALSLLAMILYALFAIANAAAAILIWFPDSKPTKNVNLAKKIYRMIVPNRFFYGVSCFLPCFPALFPYFLQRFYRTIIGVNPTVHYFGLPDPFITILLGIACVVIFALTKNAQSNLRMTPFKLYKVK